MYLLRRLASLFIVLAAITYAGFFAFLNSAPVYVILPYFGEMQTSGAVSYLLTFVAGALFASLYFVLDWTRLHFEIRRHRRTAKDLSQRPNGKSKKRPKSYDDENYDTDHDSYKEDS